MKQGSARYGIEFEARCREFLAKYGFYILGENEIVVCSDKTAHKKLSHEVDIILGISKDNLPKPPRYGPSSTENFIVSCKGGDELDGNDLADLERQLQCIAKNPKYSSITKAVLICQERKNIKPSKNIYIWDRAYMHLLGEKMRVYAMLRAGGKQPVYEIQNGSKLISVLFMFTGSKNAQTGKIDLLANMNVFNESPNDPIGKMDVEEIVKHFRPTEADKGINITKYINIFSVSGIQTDLLSHKGKLDVKDPSIFYPKMVDLSLATWAPYIDE